MNDIEELYAPRVMEEVMAMLQVAIEQVSGDEQMDRAVIHHLKQASSALDAENTRLAASMFDQHRAALSSRLLARAKVVLSRHACDPDAVTKAAQACNMSRSHFERCFRNATGASPRRLVIEARIDRARHLLLNTSSSIRDVAERCGYSEQCHFTRIFTRETGMGPGTWRRLFRTPTLRAAPVPGHR
jgi:AraC family transcriptional regulator